MWNKVHLEKNSALTALRKLSTPKGPPLITGVGARGRRKEEEEKGRAG